MEKGMLSQGLAGSGYPYPYGRWLLIRRIRTEYQSHCREWDHKKTEARFARLATSWEAVSHNPRKAWMPPDTIRCDARRA